MAARAERSARQRGRNRRGPPCRMQPHRGSLALPRKIITQWSLSFCYCEDLSAPRSALPQLCESQKGLQLIQSLNLSDMDKKQILGKKKSRRDIVWFCSDDPTISSQLFLRKGLENFNEKLQQFLFLRHSYRFLLSLGTPSKLIKRRIRQLPKWKVLEFVMHQYECIALQQVSHWIKHSTRSDSTFD